MAADMACEAGTAGFGVGVASPARATAEVAVTPRIVALAATTDMSLRLEPFKVFPFRAAPATPGAADGAGRDGRRARGERGRAVGVAPRVLRAGYAPRAAADATTPGAGPSPGEPAYYMHLTGR
ncbi:hypothetical protein GCM10010274_06950 [Streptomyces lavendofoliae]|uniref:Uncharacterized protein n=1 Tax=Streptomyces lavendofoliae TaxID=67314 RepID=A0A918HSY9_9ACTN|nr:hypothetical protein GCM10010274_06950 [Streptomyces lavendofoliae]